MGRFGFPRDTAIGALIRILPVLTLCLEYLIQHPPRAVCNVETVAIQAKLEVLSHGAYYQILSIAFTLSPEATFLDCNFYRDRLAMGLD